MYQAIFLISIAIFTFLFAKEVKGAANLFPHIDKVAHFGIFFVLAIIMDKAFKLPLYSQILLLALYGAGIEIMQDSLPYRQASFADFVADFAGAASYFLVKVIVFKYKRKSNG